MNCTSAASLLAQGLGDVGYSNMNGERGCRFPPRRASKLTLCLCQIVVHYCSWLRLDTLPVVFYHYTVVKSKGLTAVDYCCGFLMFVGAGTIVENSATRA